MSEYPLVPLGHVLSKADEWISPVPDATYQQVTVRLWGNGVTQRNVVSGAELAGSRRLVVHPGQFIVSRIDARNGAFGLVPDSLEGALVSNDFPVFDVDHTQLDSRFLGWLSKTDGFVDLCRAASEGTTNRVRLREDRFLATAIPLPPLDEQRRIVARIEALAAKIEEARGLQREVTSDTERLLVAMAHRTDLDEHAKCKLGWRSVTLGEVLKQVEDREAVVPDSEYPNFGIYSFGRGLFAKPPISGMSTSASVLYRARAGRFIYSRLFAFEGSYGIVSSEFDGYYVSNEYPMFDCDPSQITAEFLFAYFKAASVWSAVAAGSKGLGDRRQRVQPAQVLSHRLMIPPLSWQHQISLVMKQVSALHRFEAAEIDALLPAILDRAFRGEL